MLEKYYKTIGNTYKIRFCIFLYILLDFLVIPGTNRYQDRWKWFLSASRTFLNPPGPWEKAKNLSFRTRFLKENVEKQSLLALLAPFLGTPPGEMDRMDRPRDPPRKCPVAFQWPVRFAGFIVPDSSLPPGLAGLWIATGQVGHFAPRVAPKGLIGNSPIPGPYTPPFEIQIFI